ncbi:hypothetical protein [cf. Phormidesmis sp. LEGE 11477]|uniref:hypothetical protein n=1 Tax=cf. Phormidesmis sp. LEGE 11477 TaxID=1828680 RepID=UPI0018805E67|nr:hypothetical protein [cf. Phormidesmis sp. LEGE 11477]MBE9060520.1 hypothetical protein [cf. Phormidesmis sp. LEGE 11477]
MRTKAHPSTTEMQVTSIRLERSLITKLKERAGNSGYQSLMRDILWDYVNSGSNSKQINQTDIRSVMAAEARQTEKCALTGRAIEPYEEMWLAMTTQGELVPLSVDSLEEE